jgi:phytoene dehydrogenase-like protein
MFDVVRAMESLAKELGVKFQTNIEKIIVENKTAVAIQANGERIDSDLVLSGADYHHTETLLTGAQSRIQRNTGIVGCTFVFIILCGSKKSITFRITLCFSM